MAAQSVGEGSQISLPLMLYRNMNFNYSDLDSVDGTIKRGIRKINWSKNGGDFFHNFVPPSVGIHFNAVKLQDYILEWVKNNNQNISIREDNICDQNADSDFILDCSGWNRNLDKFHKSSIPVNAALVSQHPWSEPKYDYTFTIARPYGWVFGIPLQNRFSLGYIFNKDINCQEDISKDLELVQQEFGFEPQNTRYMEFLNYYRKKNYENNISYNGNCSFFLEPLEATSIHTMDFINKSSYDYFTGAVDEWVLNCRYQQWLEETEQLIMLHYLAGSKYQTEFWNHAKSQAEQCFTSSQTSKLKLFLDVYKRRAPERYLEDFGSGWNIHSFRENLNKLQVVDTLEHLISP